MSRAEDLFKEAEATVLPRDREFARLSLALADRIRVLMDRQNINQAILAKRMGKTESELSRWLTGLHNLTIRNIARINVALGVRAMDVTDEAQQTRAVTVILRQGFNGPKPPIRRVWKKQEYKQINVTMIGA